MARCQMSQVRSSQLRLQIVDSLEGPLCSIPNARERVHEKIDYCSEDVSLRLVAERLGEDVWQSEQLEEQGPLSKCTTCSPRRVGDSAYITFGHTTSRRTVRASKSIGSEVSSVSKALLLRVVGIETTCPSASPSLAEFTETGGFTEIDRAQQVTRPDWVDSQEDRDRSTPKSSKCRRFASSKMRRAP